MGRAIDMEKDIDAMKIRIDMIEKALSRVIGVVGAMEEKSQQVTHVDLTDDVKTEKAQDKPKSKKSNEKAKRPKKD